MSNVCIQCGETREKIKKRGLLCAIMSHTEAGSELAQEFNRHRFKPYSEKELAAMKADEDEYVRQMGEFANTTPTDNPKSV